MKKSNFFADAFKGVIEPSTYKGGASKLNGDFFYQLGSFFGYSAGGRSLSGYIKAFGTNILVFMIVARIAAKTSTIDIKYEDSKGNPLENSDLQELLENPNEEQGRIELIDEACQYFLTTGNTFFHYEEGIGMGEEIRCLNSSRMDVELDSTGGIKRWAYTNNMGNVEYIEPEEILHVKTSNIVQVSEAGVHFGLSPLQAAWQVIKSSDEIFEAEAAILKNRGIIGILSNESDTPLRKQDRERIQESFDEETGGADRFNKIKISNTKLKFLQTAMSPSDLKILEGIINKLRLLCAVYGMSSILFNDNANSTLDNYKEARKSAYTDAYIPLGERMYGELSRFIAKKKSVDAVAKLDITNIEELRGSTDDKINAINSIKHPRVAAQIVSSITVNQALALMGYPEISGEEGNQRLFEGKEPADDTQNPDNE